MDPQRLFFALLDYLVLGHRVVGDIDQLLWRTAAWRNAFLDTMGHEIAICQCPGNSIVVLDQIFL